METLCKFWSDNCVVANDDTRVYEIPSDEEYSEIALKQHMIQSQSSTGDFKDMSAVTALGKHILNKNERDCVLEECQNQDRWMDIRGDSIAIRFNSMSIKMLKWNNFGSNFILKHYKKIHDFALVNPKLLAVLDKDNTLTLYQKVDKQIQIPIPSEHAPASAKPTKPSKGKLKSKSSKSKNSKKGK